MSKIYAVVAALLYGDSVSNLYILGTFSNPRDAEKQKEIAEGSIYDLAEVIELDLNNVNKFYYPRQ